jgi:hypothetical protein
MGAMTAAATAILVASFPLPSLAGQDGLRIEPARPGIIEARPQSAVTVVFRAVNGTARALEVAGRLDVPEGWRVILGDPALKLKAGEESALFFSVLVPQRTVAGTYRLKYSARTGDDPAEVVRASAEIKVPAEAEISVEVLDAPSTTAAGESLRARFLVLNKGNVPLRVGVDAVSGPGFPVTPPSADLVLEAGESRTLEYVVLTDPGIRKIVRNPLRIEAKAAAPDGKRLLASAHLLIEVIPSISGQGDEFRRLPVAIGVVGMAAERPSGGGQLKIAGTGALDGEGRTQVDFLFRGPGRESLNLFGMQREDYRFSLSSPHLTLHVGDRTYSLTRLTELGNFGRGAEAGLDFGPLAFRGYAQKELFIGDPGTQTAFQFSYASDRFPNVRFSFLRQTTGENSVPSRVFSLASDFRWKALEFNLEYAWDSSLAPGVRSSNTALWLESSGRFPRFSYRATLVRSGSDFQGYYRNLDYSLGEVTGEPVRNLQLRAFFMDQKRNSPIPFYFPAFSDRTYQIGAQYQASRKWGFSLEQRTHEREDLSETTSFKYRDATWRVGATLGLEGAMIIGFADLGRTRNLLTGATERLAEYTLSGNISPIPALALGGFVHYRDQDSSFTGDRRQSLELNVTAALSLGPTSISAFLRTALYDELFASVLSERSFRDPSFLLNTYDLFGASASHRFSNGHQIGLRLQSAATPSAAGGEKTELIGLLEYSIPLGIPVGRRTDIGLLQGRVYNSESGGKGVPGVVIRINDLAAVTDERGQYAFHSLDPGEYVLSVDGQKLADNQVTLARTPMTVTVAGGEKAERSIGLVSGGQIGGRILVYQSETLPLKMIDGRDESGPSVPGQTGPKYVESGALSGAIVELSDGEILARQITDAEGRFLFEALRPAVYALKVVENALPEFHALEKAAFEVNLKAGGNETVDFKILPVIRSIQILDKGEVKVIIKK